MGLAANDWFDLEDFGLNEHAQEESWYTNAEDIQAEPSPAGLADQVVENREKRRRRWSLHRELPEKLSSDNLDVCDLNVGAETKGNFHTEKHNPTFHRKAGFHGKLWSQVVMAAEILLYTSFGYDQLRDDQALLKAAKDAIARDFQTLSGRSPISVNQHNQPGHFTDAELVQTMKALSSYYSTV